MQISNTDSSQQFYHLSNEGFETEVVPSGRGAFSFFKLFHPPTHPLSDVKNRCCTGSFLLQGDKRTSKKTQKIETNSITLLLESSQFMWD